MVLNGLKLSQMAQNGLKCFKMFQNVPKWSQMVPNGPKQVQSVLKRLNMFQMIQVGPNEHRGTLCVLV